MKHLLIAIAIVGTTSVAGLATANAPTAVTCGDTITVPGDYYLAAERQHTPRNKATGNGAYDLRDGNPDCCSASWQGNQFATANQPCIR